MPVTVPSATLPRRLELPRPPAHPDKVPLSAELRAFLNTLVKFDEDLVRSLETRLTTLAVAFLQQAMVTEVAFDPLTFDGVVKTFPFPYAIAFGQNGTPLAELLARGSHVYYSSSTTPPDGYWHFDLAANGQATITFGTAPLAGDHVVMSWFVVAK